jgi:hypothetical protein
MTVCCQHDLHLVQESTCQPVASMRFQIHFIPFITYSKIKCEIKYFQIRKSEMALTGRRKVLEETFPDRVHKCEQISCILCE